MPPTPGKTSSGNLYLGTMSGTSMDGLDLVAIKLPDHQVPQTVTTAFYPYPPELKRKLQDLALDSNASLNQMCQLDIELGQYYAEKINCFIDNSTLIPRDEILAVGSHGQTVRHAIQGSYPYTLQIGDPNIIAAKTGLVVVADFRRRDVAMRGQGAPLAPAFHNNVFRSRNSNRAIINIGGIANITYLPSDQSKQVTGFDSGPGNTLMDYLCELRFGCQFDEDGNIARSGTIETELVDKILQNEPYFNLQFPKSTGTDYFSPDWLKNTGLLDLSPEDCMASLSALTSLSISQAVSAMDEPIDEYYLCGGGARNINLTHNLSQHLKTEYLYTTDKLGIHPDWVEASAFAWLAKQTLNHQPGNLPSVTNAEKFTILGAVYF